MAEPLNMDGVLRPQCLQVGQCRQTTMLRAEEVAEKNATGAGTSDHANGEAAGSQRHSEPVTFGIVRPGHSPTLLPGSGGERKTLGPCRSADRGVLALHPTSKDVDGFTEVERPAGHLEHGALDPRDVPIVFGSMDFYSIEHVRVKLGTS